MEQQISQLSISYNYKSAQQVNYVVSDTKTSIKNYYYLTSQQRPEAEENISTHPRKSTKESKLETESPLAEKDEVKKAERRTMEQQKKIDRQQQPKKDK